MLSIKGFTLIELMISVAIVGILASVAIPAYQDYVIRAQVSEGLILASSLKTPYAEYFANKGSVPMENEDIGFTGAQGKYVDSIRINSGNIIASFNHGNQKLQNVLLILVPTLESINSNSNLTWQCFYDYSGQKDIGKYFPSICSKAPN